MWLFLDESGNTGDVVLLPGKEPFGGQPVFVLGAVGAGTGASLEEMLSALVAQHRVPLSGSRNGLQEVKGATVVQRRPEFVRDLVRSLAENHHPIIVEVVDKAFFLSANLVLHFLLGAPIASGVVDTHTPEGLALENRLVETIDRHTTREVFEAYCRACRSRSPGDLYAFMRAFALQYVPLLMRAHATEAPFVQEVCYFAKLATEAFETLRSEPYSDEELVEDFLPFPDRNARGEILAMLPHSSAFANLLARANRFATETDGGAILVVHDEQAHFGQIIAGYHDNLVNGRFTYLDDALDGADVPYGDMVRYTFPEGQTLQFEPSHRVAGIQVADILAATCRLIFERRALGKEALPPALVEVVKILRTLRDAKNGQGVNVVSTMQKAWSFFNPNGPSRHHHV